MNSDMSQQINDSAAEEDGGTTTGQEEEEDEDLDDIPSYGFPSQRSARNRCDGPDIDKLISDGGKREGKWGNLFVHELTNFGWKSRC